MVVYSKGDFKVYTDGKRGYKVHNTKYPMKIAHTHIKKLHVCKTIINNVMTGKIPKTRNLYLIESHIRVSDSIEYIDALKSLMRKKQTYYNVQNGRRK